MSYQVLARRWRPQRFDEVIGQRAVTRTLQNALATGRIAHAFVFAGPRGVGKTTTARILAKALNCVDGPTPEPCGRCVACVEIAEGRDLDVLEIDAATHTQVENIREVIIAGLALTPARDRYKIFIIDEAHQLSSHSFNALLKSLEEPPPHVIFVMATTQIEKIPDTILSRAQVFEFKPLSTKAILEQLRRIAGAEQIAIDEEALALLARAADGSMRDAQSALDQVIAFAGPQVTAADVATVLGLVGRDALLDLVEAVADEEAGRLVELAGRIVESGADLRQVCRELIRVVRDLLVIGLDPTRLEDPDIASEGERARLAALAPRFSREDLLRGFDVLARTEQEIRTAAEPRYHFEMGLLRWVHLQKLTPLADLLLALQQGEPGGERAAPSRAPAASTAGGGGGPAPEGAQTSRERSRSPRGERPEPAGSRGGPAAAAPDRAAELALVEALRAELQRTRKVFYGTVVQQARRVEVRGDRILFVFGTADRMQRRQLEQARPWIERLASELAGRKMTAVAVTEDEDPASPPAPAPPAADPRERLRAQALADATVQAMLEIFPARITDVEEI
jgi:DNA polymerase-3 subunit gamma/tau